MSASRRRAALAFASLGVVVIIAFATIAGQLPAVGANGLLHPARRRVVASPPHGCAETRFAGDGVRLEGWRCKAADTRRGTVVYLHGIADNRSSGAGIVEWFGTRGFDAIAYDSRAHGESEGDVCTYGFFERQDLHGVLDSVESGPIVLVGTSLGAAVALQEAASDTRVAAIVAAETFSDLRTVATERAPFFFTSRVIGRAFQIAEAEGRFHVDDVSPAAAARQIRIPALLIHGAADTDTPPAHSERVLAALAGPKRLILVPGARHNESLNGNVWAEIERWLNDALGARTAS